MSRFLRRSLQGLEAYTPGEQPKDRAYVKLNTNELPYPPPPAVLAALAGGQLAALNRYPDPEGTLLKEKLAAHYGAAPEEVFLANGSDDILNFAFWAFGEAGAAFPALSYSFYPVYCALHGVEAAPIPLRADYAIDPADYAGQRGMVVIANPNAPTGRALSRAEIREILEQDPDRVVLIDEAYVDFGAESALPLLKEFDNLLVVMTFSKSRGLAGARLGFAFGARALIADLKRLQYSTNPYSISLPDLLLGAAAVDSAPYYLDCAEKIIATREKTVVELQQLGFQTLPSQANFLFVRHPELAGSALYEALKARGILIRHFATAALRDYNRISIGTAEDMAALLREIRAILREERGETR